MRTRYLSLVIVFVTLQACGSYYQRHYDFNREFENGRLGQALETLQQNDRLATSKSKFIYFADNGLLLSIMGRYEESNAYFEKAFLFGEDYRVNYLNEAASYWTNPTMTVYRGEDHEHLIVLYYKALNYLKLGQHEQALIECRRLNIRLQQLSDHYSSSEKYKDDAFIHTLMGIIYQSSHDYNNAFIAYRNALEIYDTEYTKLFGVEAPRQLKIDLLNTAYWTGFKDEFEFYKNKFGMDSYQPTQPDASLVFFWHNGLGPIKDEWSINFAVHHPSSHAIEFYNDALGLRFPFTLENDQQQNNLANLEIFRVAFPRYVERPSYYQSASVEVDSVEFPLELAEDVNRIAFHSLHERMVWEFGKGLLRAALKKATEHSIRKEDETLGSVIGLVNAMTEHADTRNWQTLPYSISYTRVDLKEGTNSLHFKLQPLSETPVTYNFTYQAEHGQTLFHTFLSLETRTR